MRVVINAVIGASVLAAAACDGGGFSLEPLTVDGYGSLDFNPVMAGGELWASAIFFTDYDAHTRSARVTVTPPELAEVSLAEDGDFLVIHPRAAQTGTATVPLTYPEDGYGTFHVELENGSVFDQRFWVEPAVSSSIEVDGVPLSAFPDHTLPGGRLAVFEGERLSLSLRHRAADGKVTLGHDGSTWTADGIQMAELDAVEREYHYDLSLLRYAQAIAAGAATIRAGDASLALDIVPQRTTARLEALGPGATPIDAEHPLAFHLGESPSLVVMAYTEDGRYIFGGSPFIPVVVTSTNVGVVQPRDGQSLSSRIVRLDGYGSGTATVTISFDGQSIDVPVTVE